MVLFLISMFIIYLFILYSIFVGLIAVGKKIENEYDDGTIAGCTAAFVCFILILSVGYSIGYLFTNL